jgi:hypothetical protein
LQGKLRDETEALLLEKGAAGADGVPTYTYRGEVANNGIKMAGTEVPPEWSGAFPP